MKKGIYTWKDEFGDYEFPIGEEEQAFIDWAVNEGYRKHDAILVMAGTGDFDVPCLLDDAWAPFHAAWEASSKCGIDEFKKSKPTIWLTWAGLRTKPETHQLLAVSLSSWHAYRARKALENQYEDMEIPVRVWTEEREANHMYGYGMLAAVSQIGEEELSLENTLDSISPRKSADDMFPDEVRPKTLP